jgi:hypothetical protein
MGAGMGRLAGVGAPGSVKRVSARAYLLNAFESKTDYGGFVRWVKWEKAPVQNWPMIRRGLPKASCSMNLMEIS